MGSEAGAAEMARPLLAAGDEAVPPWREQLTARGLAASAALGVLFCLISHRLLLTTGIVPSLNIAAALLGFFLVQTWTKALQKLRVVSRPFTKQENTVIQTCVVACCGIAGSDFPGNRPVDVKNPSLGWMIGFMFAVNFFGLFSLVALRKVMVIDYKLTYPSGKATATLINSLHTTSGAQRAEDQVKCLGKYLSISFLWNCFKWFFSGVGNSCGF